MTATSDDQRPAPPTGGENSEPHDPDGQFDSQDMPTTDGEMSDGAAELTPTPRPERRSGSAGPQDDPR